MKTPNILLTPVKNTLYERYIGGISVAYELIDVIDLSKQFEGIEPHFTWRIYINKDQQTGRYKVVVSGLSRKEYLNIYGSKAEVEAKIKDLIAHLGKTLEAIHFS